jgi:hypothetical protein
MAQYGGAAIRINGFNVSDLFDESYYGSCI